MHLPSPFPLRYLILLDAAASNNESGGVSLFCTPTRIPDQMLGHRVAIIPKPSHEHINRLDPNARLGIANGCKGIRDIDAHAFGQWRRSRLVDSVAVLKIFLVARSNAT